LSRNDARNLAGNKGVIVSPFGDGKTPEELLTLFSEEFVPQFKGPLLESVLISLEKENLAKFSPRSIAKPWEARREDLLASFEGRNAMRDLHMDSGRLRPLNNVRASEFLLNNTSSGLPYMRRKGDVKDKALNDYHALIAMNLPAVLFTRTQEGGKTRNVWGFAIAQTLREMRYYRLLLEVQKKKDWRSALVGPDAVAQQVTNALDYAEATGKELVSIDFSAYDTTISDELIARSFELIGSMFQSANHDEIVEIANYFHTVGIWTPDGVYQGPHGVPSGSTFTNEVDSIAQYIVAWEHGFEHMCQIQGDDGLYVVDDASRVHSAFTEAGMKVNEDKSAVSKDYVLYLRNLFSRFYFPQGRVGGIYPISRALNRIIYLERWSNLDKAEIGVSEFYAIRTIAILENCKHHPLFEPFVKWCAKLDRTSLEYSQAGLAAYAREAKSRGVAGVTARYGDEVAGINDFETVKILQSIR